MSGLSKSLSNIPVNINFVNLVYGVSIEGGFSVSKLNQMLCKTERHNQRIVKFNNYIIRINTNY